MYCFFFGSKTHRKKSLLCKVCMTKIIFRELLLTCLKFVDLYIRVQLRKNFLSWEVDWNTQAQKEIPKMRSLRICRYTNLQVESGRSRRPCHRPGAKSSWVWVHEKVEGGYRRNLWSSGFRKMTLSERGIKRVLAIQKLVPENFENFLVSVVLEIIQHGGGAGFRNTFWQSLHIRKNNYTSKVLERHLKTSSEMWLTLFELQHRLSIESLFEKIELRQVPIAVPHTQTFILSIMPF